jgi:hypothetical protein
MRAMLASAKVPRRYGPHVDVLRVHGRVLVVSDTTGSGLELEEPYHLPSIDEDRPRRSRRTLVHAQ